MANPSLGAQVNIEDRAQAESACYASEEYWRVLTSLNGYSDVKCATLLTDHWSHGQWFHQWLADTLTAIEFLGSDYSDIRNRDQMKDQ